MSQIMEGGYAFPSTLQTRGMSLRDYFAGAALTGLLAKGLDDGCGARTAATEAYGYADAMLRQCCEQPD